MAKPNKAQIAYSIGEDSEGVDQQNVIRFHSVETEEHEVEATITKFPVQSQAYVSNHSIRQNRVVTIKGLVSNTVVKGQGEEHYYGGGKDNNSGNTTLVKDELSRLIQEAVPCEVVTNLGIYTPVIWRKFKTKQEAGMTDAMSFTLTGEEIILGTSVNQTTPVKLKFKVVEETKRAAVVEECAKAGIIVDDTAIVTQADCDFGKDWQADTLTTNGASQTITSTVVANDETAKNYNSEINTSDTDVAVAAATSSSSIFDTTLNPVAGINVAGACLADGLVGIGNAAASGFIDTALGSLRKTAYGAAYEMFGVNGNKNFGQVLLALSADCLVAGAVGAQTGEDGKPLLTPDDYQENPLPTVESMTEGARAVGNRAAGITGSAIAPSTMTKISGGTGVVNPF